MANWVMVLALMSVAFPSNVIGQTNDTPVGTWRLISSTDTTEKGEVNDSFGRNPTGFLTYTADGRMMAIITFDGRKPLSVPDYISAPAQERAEAFATFVAYAGRYTFTGDKVIHHVEAAWMESYVKTDQERMVRFQGNRMTIRTPPFLKGGVKLAYQELVWERMMPETPDRPDRN